MTGTLSISISKLTDIESNGWGRREYLDRIKRSGTPSRPHYYDHIPTPKRWWHYDKQGNLIVTGCLPDYPNYGVNGYGYPGHLSWREESNWMPSRIAIGKLTKPLCGEEWLANHYEKYPNGVLPEQTITKQIIKREVSSV